MKGLPVFVFLATIFCACEKQETSTGNIIVEAYLYVNRPFDSIKITETVSSEMPFFSNPVINAEVVIESAEKKYRLSDLPNHPGIYQYTGNDFTIEPNTCYNLTVEYKNYELLAQTVTPSGSSCPVLSNDTLVPVETVTPKDIYNTYAVLSWKSLTDYTFIMKNYIEKDTVPIEFSSFINSTYLPYYLQQPFLGSVVVIQMQDFKYYGKYKMVVCQVNEDFVNLFEESDERPISLMQENINGGLGIFTGIYSDTVLINVVKK